MMKKLLLLAWLLFLPVRAAAQQPDTTAPQRVPEPHWSTLRVAKWATLAGTVATAIYGVSTISAADHDYEQLELDCQAARLVCGGRGADGSYRDAGLESQYQAVLRQDHRARTALLASQVGVATTVLLFVLDLRHARSPKDIPYHPEGLELVPRKDGVELRVTLPAR